MATSDLKVKTDTAKPPGRGANASELEYGLTFVESPTSIVSLFRQIRERLREPKIKQSSKYYRGEARLPVTEMRPWYRDLPSQIKILFEKPRDPIGAFNRVQDEKRVLCGLIFGCLGAAAGWEAEGASGIALGVIAGYVVGQVVGVFLFKKRDYPPDIWHDYRPQAASWINSLLVHGVGLMILLLPFIVRQVVQPVKASEYKVVDISPYLADLLPSAKKAGGGGGGGDRTPKPPSQGAVPKFAKEQLAPPMAVIPNTIPKIPVQPSILGPPDLKLPQMMAKSTVWGDPEGVLAPASNGPGAGGGIGTGTGTGIGSGKGGGLGPGEGGGTGGGPYSVGGNVSAPIPIYKPEPNYSEEARKAKYQGTVVLWIVVDAQGNVSPEIRVVKPLGLGLDEKALEAVRTWKFKPALRNGAPVPVHVMVEVSFRLF